MSDFSSLESERKKQILIVDDQVFNIDTLKSIL